MYADAGLLFSYLQNFSQDIQLLEEYYQKPNSSMSNMIPMSMISEYELGTEEDLFKAPEPIIEEPLNPLIDLDPITAAISMISCGDSAMSSQGLTVADIDSVQPNDLLSEVFYGCENDFTEKASFETPLSEILDMKILPDGIQTEENKLLSAVSLPGSFGSACLASMDWFHVPPLNPSFLDFSDMDLGAVNGMRRAYSEGDVKTLADGNTNIIQSPHDRSLAVAGSCIADQRREQLSRYRNKKTKRNFERKIKYACRKALADSQPRFRGRFAKTEESEILRRH